MPCEIPKRDVLTTYCAQSTFMGCHSQVRMHTREITIRKSHPLEGSCQEAIRPLYTTFDIFSRCVPIGTLYPRCVISDASVFSLSWRRLRCAAPATHQDQGALTSRVLARRSPLARSVPQKTLGSPPCPIDTSHRCHGALAGPTFQELTAEASQDFTSRWQAICHGLRLGLIRRRGL